jgi:hypothetical protein
MAFVGGCYLHSNEEVLLKVKEERNILHAIKRRKANLIGHILRRKYFYKKKKVVEGKIKEIQKEREGEKEELSNHPKILRIR